MYALKNISRYSLNRVCFLMDVANLIRKLRSIVDYRANCCEELIKSLNNVIIENSKDAERYESEYGYRSIENFDIKMTFENISKCHSDVYHINTDANLLEQIESFLVEDAVIERIVVSVKNEEYVYERESSDLYKFLRKLDVEIFPIEMIEDLNHYGLENLLYSDCDMLDRSSEYEVRFGEFNIMRIKDEQIQCFVNKCKKEASKMDILKFYISMYVGLSENAELIGMKVKDGYLEVLSVTPMSGVKSLHFCRNKVEAVVMMYLLRKYMVMEEVRCAI